MDDLDYWLAMGFGGIVNLLHARVTQYKEGFSERVRRLLGMEARRMAELNEIVQASPGSSDDSDPLCVDRWFVRAFTGIDQHLATRSAEGPVPMCPTTLRLMEDHARRILKIIEVERGKH